MVREQRGLPAAVVGGPKERHMRQNRSQLDPSTFLPEDLLAKPAVPKSKHHTYFEFATNENKKKKLEYQVSNDRKPPPGFEFVPMGNPDLTTACKEISREKDAMIFIVSNSRRGTANQIPGQMGRIGYHIRAMIVEEAKASLKNFSQLPVVATNGAPEPIPESQEEYHAQADAAIRDLFPRIPNTDRQAIIDHSFTQVRLPPLTMPLANPNGIQGVSTRAAVPVGLSRELPLVRRVQLAVLAHIRHTHTPYDRLLKLRDVSWDDARKMVEKRCLDTLVQWRGDEETGRDQLDEILREVVVISDSETGDSEDESTDATSAEDADMELVVAGPSSQRYSLPRIELDTAMDLRIDPPGTPLGQLQPSVLDLNPQVAKFQRRNQRGFKRYRAWEEAIRRNREVRGSSTMETDTGSYPGYSQQQPLQSVPLTQPVYGTSFASATSRPRTPPSQDVPLPSIETTSPQTMEPSFVRRIPLRGDMNIQHSDTWDQTQYLANVPGRNTHAMVPSGSALQYSGAPPQVPAYPYQAPYGTAVHMHASRQVSDVQPPGPNVPSQAAFWQAQGAAAAHRIIMDVNRPGERSNPIVMEDRGGFYERVTQPEEQRISVLEPPILIREVHRWSRPPEPYGNRMYVARRQSPMVPDHDMDGVELYPAPPPRDATHMMPQWGPQYHTGPSQPVPLAVSDLRDQGATHARAVSQPPFHAEHQEGFPSPRRDVNQSSRGTRDGQYAHTQTRGHGYRSPPIPASPRRQGPRGNVIVLD
ncbi:hypothetical protein LLEC1_06104 [Akanthomyces lecanii]|uniref:DUF2293 domain-containing protein n=1 Tax=Cordyceps confragosa TaxID=2714763 RepID=A0A179I6X3_CORDF|nr:hypothetical protein LLEC1_06104 [Akanthomyces lecanii]